VKAIRIHAFGGADALCYEDVPEPSPKAGEVVVTVEAAGVNFIDIYQRTGLYPVPLPATLGQEGAGAVTAVGPSVADFRTGDKVAWTGIPGSYAERVVVPTARLVSLPPGITPQQGAAAMLQGLTAHYLGCTTHPLKQGETCLIHAGAGGVGLLLTQLAKLRGARVITTVSTDEKAELSRAAGADYVIPYTSQDFEEAVKRLTGGTGVQVVYDSVGQTTWAKSLNCLATRGMLVLFGQSSGAVPPIDPLLLSQKGSLFLTRPSLVHHIAGRAELEQRARDLFSWIAAGVIELRTEFAFPLASAAEAHQALEGRKTTGKVLLIPAS
jgi:NADPH2:quinone reductase